MKSSILSCALDPEAVEDGFINCIPGNELSPLDFLMLIEDEAAFLGGQVTQQMFYCELIRFAFENSRDQGFARPLRRMMTLLQKWGGVVWATDGKLGCVFPSGEPRFVPDSLIEATENLIAYSGDLNEPVRVFNNLIKFVLVTGREGWEKKSSVRLFLLAKALRIIHYTYEELGIIFEEIAEGSPEEDRGRTRARWSARVKKILPDLPSSTDH